MIDSMLAAAPTGPSVPMPDANSEITSVLLHRDPSTRARTMITGFPAGFERPVFGHYDAGEELLLLSGALTISGMTLHEGDWAWLPPGVLRHDFRSESGAVVFAWFSAGNDWIRGGEGVPHAARRTFVGLSASSPTQSLRGGVDGDGPGRSAVVSAGAQVDGPAEVVELGAGSWQAVAAGEAYTPTGACFVRWPTP